jgi:hypothetical protein
MITGENDHIRKNSAAGSRSSWLYRALAEDGTIPGW